MSDLSYQGYCATMFDNSTFQLLLKFDNIRLFMVKCNIYMRFHASLAVIIRNVMHSSWRQNNYAKEMYSSCTSELCKVANKTGSICKKQTWNVRFYLSIRTTKTNTESGVSGKVDMQKCAGNRIKNHRISCLKRLVVFNNLIVLKCNNNCFYLDLSILKFRHILRF